MEPPKAVSPGCELVIGLVGPIGTALSTVSEHFRQALTRVGFPCSAVHDVHVVELLHEIPKFKDLPHQPEWKRYRTHIRAASQFCEAIDEPAGLALLTVARILDLRGDKGAASEAARRAFIVRSLKRPEEVELLREIYGRSFTLVACSADREQRIQSLEQRFQRAAPGDRNAQFAACATALVDTDAFEDRPSGQNVRDTFAMADFFLDASTPSNCAPAVERFIELLFGHPFITPSSDEYSMFQASSAALRSADLSRQVGAALVRDRGEILALGCNDAPRFGGGQYWCGDDPDGRDFVIGADESFEERKAILGDLLARLRRTNWLSESLTEPLDELVRKGLASKQLRDARVMDVLEFGRSVHAEMAAICDAARRGVATATASLFSTTYPCHECARHIIGAGITRVVYIAPYPKSAASRLFKDSWSHANGSVPRRVRVEPFIGVGPRIYPELFSMRKRKESTGGIAKWNGNRSVLRRREPRANIEAAEISHLSRLKEILVQKGLKPQSTTTVSEQEASQ